MQRPLLILLVITVLLHHLLQTKFQQNGRARSGNTDNQRYRLPQGEGPISSQNLFQALCHSQTKPFYIVHADYIHQCTASQRTRELTFIASTTVDYLSMSNPTLSLPSSSTFPNLFDQSDAYRIKEREIYDNYNGDVAKSYTNSLRRLMSH